MTKIQFASLWLLVLASPGQAHSLAIVLFLISFILAIISLVKE
jgi:hypothetical protein